MLHVLDEAAVKRLGRDAYYGERAKTEDGRTQAALMLVRGIAHHHLAEVQASMLRESKMFLVQAGGLVPAQTFQVRDGGLVPMSTHMMSRGWPPLSDLPASTEPSHNRDRYYADHVEGKGLVQPLLAAQRFVTTLQD